MKIKKLAAACTALLMTMPMSACGSTVQSGTESIPTSETSAAETTEAESAETTETTSESTAAVTESAETTETASESTAAVTESAETTETASGSDANYWSVPLSDTYLIDGYDYCSKAPEMMEQGYQFWGMPRQEMLDQGYAMTKKDLEEHFTITPHVGYLSKTEKTEQKTTPWDYTYDYSNISVSDENQDSGNPFSIALQLTPTTDDWSIVWEGSVSYQIRVVDINGNVVNTDWEEEYSAYCANMGQFCPVHVLDDMSDGNVPVENIDYIEWNITKAYDLDGIENAPILDCVIQCFNPYGKNYTAG